MSYGWLIYIRIILKNAFPDNFEKKNLYRTLSFRSSDHFVPIVIDQKKIYIILNIAYSINIVHTVVLKRCKHPRRTINMLDLYIIRKLLYEYVFINMTG